MKRKNCITLICSLLILSAIGLGLSIIYSDYLYSPTGSLDTLQVMSSSESLENSSVTSVSDVQLLQNIEQWAEKNNATILFKSGLLAGCGFCGYSDWANQFLHISTLSNTEDGIYIADDPDIQAAYVQNNIFLPGSAGLEIKGTYDTSALPPILNHVDFLYPLSISSVVSGMYFTDATDIQSLIELFESNGYSVVSTRQANTLSLGQLLLCLITDSILSQAVLLALGGLMFCFVYGILMSYRDNAHRLWVHHLFGLSKKGILAGVLTLSLGMILISSLLFSAILYRGLTYLSITDLRRIFIGALIVSCVLTISVNGIGYFRLLRQFRKRGA